VLVNPICVAIGEEPAAEVVPQDEDGLGQIPVIGDAVPAPVAEDEAPNAAVDVGGIAAAVAPPVVGFVPPAFGQPALPAAALPNLNQEFVESTVALGMIIHPHVAPVIAQEQLPPIDMYAAAEALHARAAFTNYRNELLGPWPHGCCEY
jgi:hypothetical protein